MKELAKRLGRLNSLNSDSLIEDSFRAYQISGYSGDAPISILILGSKRIGRELIKTTVDRNGIHIHHYLYFYDWVDPQRPQVRCGIEVNKRRMRLYEAPLEGSRKDVGYIDSPTQEQINFSFHFLSQMPTGPGDFRFRVEPYKP